MNAYVYRLDNKYTSEFYFGFRCANKIEPNLDLGKKYFTSSNYVKNRFSDFDITYILEFDSKEEAYYKEQTLIQENWSNPLLINKYVRSGKALSTFNWKPSEELREHWSTVRKGGKHKGANNGRYGKTITVDTSYITEEYRKKCAQTKYGKSNKMSRYIYHTPFGTFDSITKASLASGVIKETLIYRSIKNIKGYSRTLMCESCQ